MNFKLTILAVNTRSGRSIKTGRDYTMHEAQCVITAQREGQEPVVNVGTVMLADALKDTPQGDYIPDFMPRVRDGRIDFEVAGLKPLNARPAAQPANKQPVAA
ncbi:hypothetical protein ACUXAV_001622 [Cupriavidus metallidurans]|uniref:hypothetical protein n=1 Tax=Cupriavidus metallidurans TaxID=119219 RepID=UPI00069224A6|nr:hypothetical protein [Cupriavidus metallidurans]AVA32829.1 hypothetical protein C3Z06_03860 [Cupriavidus metallidurans]MDE4917003.1 hypothetical protein [Cupriavidus metallidurans]